MPITPPVETKPRLKRAISTALITLMTLWTLSTLLWLTLPKGVADGLITRARLTLQRPVRSAARVPTADHSNAAAQPSRSSQDQPAPAPRPVYRTTAEQLYRAFDANAVAIQNSIGASLVRLTGSVAEIDQDATGHPVVKLWTADDSSAAITLTLAANQRAAAAQLIKGEGVDIECNKIDRSGAVLQGNDCSLAFVDTRTREVNLALFLTTQSGAAQVYVVGPMPESVCRARSEEISAGLRAIQRGGHLVWRNCTDGARESILPGGCHLNSRPVTLANVPGAHLWHYDCSSSSVARTANATRPTPPGRPPTPIEIAAAEAAAPPDPPPTQRATASNIRVASAGTSDIGTATPATGTGTVTPAETAVPVGAATAPPASPAAVTTHDDLAQVRAADPNAADHIAAYCSKTDVLTGNRDAFMADCRRSEAAAWTRLVLQNEFPTLDDATRRKCSEPPVPDTWTAKETCAKYALHVN